MRAPLTKGRELGAFRLERKLALGGMAEIWSATEALPTGGTKQVALKVMLREHTVDRHFQDMFWDEVNISRRLKHENIVRVFDAREVEGHLFHVLELVDGIDVRRVLSALARNGEWFPVPYVVMVARDMARALNYAHQKIGPNGQPMKIVHRDISPHNVMVTRKGIAKVLDFGIARASERLAKTRTGVIKGKVAYMAPEQAMSTTVDARADIFATGVVLWEMLAMERLFRADNETETVRLLMSGLVPPIQAKNSQVPDDLAELVHHMLAVNPKERPQTMQQVENRLSRSLAIDWEPEETAPAALAGWLSPHLEAKAEKARRKTAVLEPDPRDTQPTESDAPSIHTAPTEEDIGAGPTRIDLEPPTFD